LLIDIRDFHKQLWLPVSPWDRHRFAVLQKHCNNVVQVVIDFVQRFALGVSAGKTWNETDEQTSLWAPLNYR
jgi:hypothetical protein